MINNPNYNPFYTDDATISRYEKGKRRMLVDNRNPHERIVPEGFCSTCRSFTTAYNSRGECEVCKTEVTADISEEKYPTATAFAGRFVRYDVGIKN